MKLAVRVPLAMMVLLDVMALLAPRVTVVRVALLVHLVPLDLPVPLVPLVHLARPEIVERLVPLVLLVLVVPLVLVALLAPLEHVVTRVRPERVAREDTRDTEVSAACRVFPDLLVPMESKDLLDLLVPLDHVDLLAHLVLLVKMA